MNQISSTPTKKVTAGGLAGALTILIVWGVDEGLAVEVPGHVGAAFTTIFTFLAAYITQSRPSEVEVWRDEG